MVAKGHGMIIFALAYKIKAMKHTEWVCVMKAMTLTG